MSFSPKDFGYELPPELIARYPAARRRDSRLLCLHGETGAVQHRRFNDLPSLLNGNDLLVFNDTRVIPARLFGRKESGGRVEVLLERMLGGGRVLAQIRSGKSPRPGGRIRLGTATDRLTANVIGREDDFYVLDFPQVSDLGAALDKFGHTPLPPYIKRDPEPLDRERYQTVYAKRDGAVAAPTAGLHFDEEMLAAIGKQGVAGAYVTLHVGAGTFQPVRVDDIRRHRMHSEYVEVSRQVVEDIRACRERGGRVIAVGTTSVRSLETACAGGELRPFRGETDIFIYPGYEFRVVDAMVTNFHLPESTLIMLVSAFCRDKEILLDAYREAVERRYRFFSYGDAMFVQRAEDSSRAARLGAVAAAAE